MSATVIACPSCGTKNRVPVASTGRVQCASCHTPLPWLVDASDADFAAAVEPSPRGEYELTDAVRLALASGVVFDVVPSSEGVLDMSERADIASVAAALSSSEVVL